MAANGFLEGFRVWLLNTDMDQTMKRNRAPGSRTAACLRHVLQSNGTGKELLSVSSSPPEKLILFLSMMLSVCEVCVCECVFAP